MLSDGWLGDANGLKNRDTVWGKDGGWRSGSDCWGRVSPGGRLIDLGLGFLDTTRAGSFANLDRSPPEVQTPHHDRSF